MEVLNNSQIEGVAGGMSWFAGLGGAVVFVYLNLEKIGESIKGFADGYRQGFDEGNNSTGSGPTAMCTP